MAAPYDFQVIDGPKEIRAPGVVKGFQQVDGNLKDIDDAQTVQDGLILSQATSIAQLNDKFVGYAALSDLTNIAANSSTAIGSATMTVTNGWNVVVWCTVMCYLRNPAQEGRLKVGINLGGGETTGQEINHSAELIAATPMMAQFARSGTASGTTLTVRALAFQVGGASGDVDFMAPSLLYGYYRF